MIDEYVDWLATVYAERTGRDLSLNEIRGQATKIIRRHSSRLPGEDDFVSLVAAEMIDRINLLETNSEQSFIRLLELSSDAVRHRIIRDTKKRLGDSSPHIQAKHTDSDAVKDAIENEIISALSLEEQTVLQLIMKGKPPEEIALILNVSPRTLYRRLADIKTKIAGEGSKS